MLQKDGVSPEITLDQVNIIKTVKLTQIFKLFLQAEKDLRIAQSEFDRQVEITRLLLEGISNSHNTHMRLLYEFVETQSRYFAECSKTMTELQEELAR